MDRQQAAQIATLGGLLVVAVVSSLGIIQIGQLDGAIRELLKQAISEKRTTMQYYETTVTSASTGDVTLVHTERNAGESVDDWKARHDAAVAAAKL